MTNLFDEFVSVCFGGSRTAAAGALGIDKSMVSRLCKGTRVVSPGVAEKVETISDGRYRKEALVWPESKAA